MNKKNILITLVLLIVLSVGVYGYKSIKKDAEIIVPVVQENIKETKPVVTPNSVKPVSENSLKTEKFSGKLEEVNVGCFVDGECYVVVDKRHVTVIMGWSQEIVGAIIGAPSIGDLEAHKGEEIEVYAQKKSDGTYTLYGSDDFYVKVK